MGVHLAIRWVLIQYLDLHPSDAGYSMIMDEQKIEWVPRQVTKLALSITLEYDKKADSEMIWSYGSKEAKFKFRAQVTYSCQGGASGSNPRVFSGSQPKHPKECPYSTM